MSQSTFFAAMEMDEHPAGGCRWVLEIDGDELGIRRCGEPAVFMASYFADRNTTLPVCREHSKYFQNGRQTRFLLARL